MNLFCHLLVCAHLTGQCSTYCSLTQKSLLRMTAWHNKNSHKVLDSHFSQCFLWLRANICKSLLRISHLNDLNSFLYLIISPGYRRGAITEKRGPLLYWLPKERKRIKQLLAVASLSKGTASQWIRSGFFISLPFPVLHFLDVHLQVQQWLPTLLTVLAGIECSLKC